MQQGDDLRKAEGAAGHDFAVAAVAVEVVEN